MNQYYAEIFPDTKILDFNRHFDYKVPAKFSSKLKVGNLVKIPLKNRIENGYVSRIKKNSSINDSDLKYIEDITGDISIFDNVKLKLIHWMCAYYVQPFGKIASLFLPPVSKEKIFNILKNPEKGLKYIKILSLNQELLPAFLKKSVLKRYAQQKIIIDFISCEGCLEKKYLLEKFKSSTSSLRSLIKAGVVIENSIRYVRQKDFAEQKKDFENNQATGLTYRPDAVNSADNNKDDKKLSAFIDEVKTNIIAKKFKGYLLKGFSFNEKLSIVNMLCSFTVINSKKALVLVPEAADAERLSDGLDTDFKKDLCVYYSDKNPSGRFDDWYDIIKDRFSIIIGTRSAVFLPYKDTGIIILDEEHDTSYKDSSIVRYNTQDIVLKLGNILKIPVLFFSNTPSVKSMYFFSNTEGYCVLNKNNTEKNEFTIKKEIIDLKKIDRFKDDIIITKNLHQHINAASARDEISLVFANRRGYSSFITCKNCGNTPKCPNCNISYSFHSDKNILLCHHCSKSVNFSGICNNCGGKNFIYKGNGIENIEAKLKNRFPKVPVIRLDSDIIGRSTPKKKENKKNAGIYPSILLGTRKMLSNIYFENITISAITDFDSLLQMPDFHVNERAFQIMDKIAAFLKKDSRSRFIVQAFNTENTTLNNFINNDYEAFYKLELKNREELNYPPYSNLVNIIISGKNEKNATRDIESIYSKIALIKTMDLSILGPSPAPYYKINQHYRWHILIKTHDIMRFNIKLAGIIGSFNKKEENKIIVDVDPVWIL